MSYPPTPHFGKAPVSTKRYFKTKREMDARPRYEIETYQYHNGQRWMTYWSCPTAQLHELLRVKAVLESLEWKL